MRDEHRNSDGGGGSAGAARSYAFSPWKRLSCVLAGAALVAGLGLHIYGAVQGSGARTAPTSSGSGTDGTASLVGKNSFLPGEYPTSQTGKDGAGVNAPPAQAAERESTWSPFLIKGGAGFLMGFCIGFALRKFLRISVAIVGLVLVGLFAFQYLGLINVNWTTIQEQLDVVGTRLKSQFESFQTFIAGALPAGGLGALGLFTGFNRR